MSDNGDAWLAGIVVATGGASAVLWAGAHGAAALGGTDFEGHWGQAFGASSRLAQDPSDPTGAWRSGTLPGPALYWFVTIIVALLGLAVAVGFWLLWTHQNVGLNRDKRLGLIPDARMATKAEIRPLIISKTVAGRFSFGRVMGKIVATEDPETQSAKDIRNRKKTRVGDRTSVMIFGPSRSGKTATVVPGVLEWDHPAIISSVKEDLMDQTLQRRLQIGQVFLFDPFMVVPITPAGVTRVSWSPISCSGTISGAQAAARTLADAAATDDLTSQGFWADRGAALLWPMLFAAAIATPQLTMADVVRWLSSHDGIDSEKSQIISILKTEVESKSVLWTQARSALTTFEGWAEMDPKQRADQSSTAQSLVSCWTDPFASAASDTRLFPPIDLPTILDGRNTLYIVQPLGLGDHFAPLFGGLFGDLVKDQTYRIAQAAKTRIGPLLALLDEAGNTPLRWLPKVASTCAGIGVQLVTVWQDMAQMEADYKKEYQSLLNNHATKVFFAGQSDFKTLDYASKLCGEEEVTSSSASADMHLGSARRTASLAPTTKRLVPPEMLRQIPTGTALLVHNTLPPVHMDGRMLPEETELLAHIEDAGKRPALEDGLEQRLEGQGPSIEALDIDPRVRAAFKFAKPVLPEHVLQHLADRQPGVVVALNEYSDALNPQEDPGSSPDQVSGATGSFGDLNQ